jgi:hypothetical protein
MQFKIVNKIAVTLSLIASLTAPVTAQALLINGMLGDSAFAHDAYTFSCPVNTIQVQVRIIDGTALFNSPNVYIIYGEDGSPTLMEMDSESTSTSSPWAINTADKNGAYNLIIAKSGQGQEDYSVEVQCLDLTLSTLLGPKTMKRTIDQ